jgi:RNA polymerase sigma-70 factor (ECF subfamily)
LGDSDHGMEMSQSGTEADPSVPGLVAEAQQGDQRSFERLYHLHVGFVYALCLRLVGDPVRAEILTQDVFVRMWEKIGTYRGSGAFGAWARRLAINVVVEDRRAEARQRRWLEPDGDEWTTLKGEGRSRMVKGSHSSDTVIDLERAIESLPEGARVAFVLHDVYGYRHREIAEMTGAASGTIKAQVHRARKLLRDSLNGSREVMEG